MLHLINYSFFRMTSFGFSWHRLLQVYSDENRDILQRSVRYSTIFSQRNRSVHCVKSYLLLLGFVFLWFNASAQRQDISLNASWLTSLNNKEWKKVNIPHNWDDYYGYRRLLHGNLHGDAVYKRIVTIKQSKKGKRFFLFFEGVGSYATVFLNNKKVGEHNGGRTTFTIDVTDVIKADGSKNELMVKASHPANIKDQPWVCGGCSEERGFSEGSQPLGIFRPVHLIVTNDVRIEPFGVHAWADVKSNATDLWMNTTFKNYASQDRTVEVISQLKDADGKVVANFSAKQLLKAKDSVALLSTAIKVANPKLWSVESPYLYKIETLIKDNNIVIDKLETDFGFRTVKWDNPSRQFTLNGKPVFLNGIAEYEHLLGQSHAFSNEQIEARIKWIQAAGFNAFRDGHQPHNLLYGKLLNEKGILWWTQLSAHVWYDTKVFRDNFKTLLKEWVIERRNDPSVILWGLQNESKLPKDFAEECTALIRSLDPTASTQRLVTTCNGGEGTDWDVPQNWTGTYGGNPDTYGKDLKRDILIGEYGAWRTIDLHDESEFKQDGPYSEERFASLMEKKIRLSESVKDSVAGHFMWLLTSHDNPGRIQGGEGLRELDRIGPVNYKGLLTPWEEPTDAFYMYRSNYADKYKEPMVYIVSHTWPNRWMTPGIKNGIIVYSNCDEVELFNDVENVSLGKQKRNGIGTHFRWDSANIRYNVLYAVGYVNGKAVAKDVITLFHLPKSPGFDKLFTAVKNITKPQVGYNYLYRINCGGPEYKDVNGNAWQTDKGFVTSWTKDFPELPKDFASQRRTFSPIKGTKDWKLFQAFRYGKDKLQYEFKVPNGEYLVELYFIEPWLGVGGGMNAKAMRLFDVVINGKKVLDDLDIWNEAGTDKVLKKSIKAKAVNGKLIISFPESKTGQAVISAIAVASINGNKKAGEYYPFLREVKSYGFCKEKAWMDIGDNQYYDTTIQFNYLPPELFGATWFQSSIFKGSFALQFHSVYDVDVYVGIDTSLYDPATGKGYDTTELQPDLKRLSYERTNSKIVTTENGGRTYIIYKLFWPSLSPFDLSLYDGYIVAVQPHNNMPPAYDLKPITQYKANVVKLNGGAVKDSVNGRYCAVITTNSPTAIDYPVHTGVGDRYSVTIKYFFNNQQIIKGKWQLIDAGGTMMQEEPVVFTFTRPGKWNQFTINTSSQINAGNYTVRLVVESGGGLALSGIDVQ